MRRTLVMCAINATQKPEQHTHIQPETPTPQLAEAGVCRGQKRPTRRGKRQCDVKSLTRPGRQPEIGAWCRARTCPCGGCALSGLLFCEYVHGRLLHRLGFLAYFSWPGRPLPVYLYSCDSTCNISVCQRATARELYVLDGGDYGHICNVLRVHYEYTTKQS